MLLKQTRQTRLALRRLSAFVPSTTAPHTFFNKKKNVRQHLSLFESLSRPSSSKSGKSPALEQRFFMQPSVSTSRLRRRAIVVRAILQDGVRAVCVSLVVHGIKAEEQLEAASSMSEFSYRSTTRPASANRQRRWSAGPILEQPVPAFHSNNRRHSVCCCSCHEAINTFTALVCLCVTDESTGMKPLDRPMFKNPSLHFHSLKLQ